MCVIQYLGFTLIAMSVLPIGMSSLVYGRMSILLIAKGAAFLLTGLCSSSHRVQARRVGVRRSFAVTQSSIRRWKSLQKLSTSKVGETVLEPPPVLAPN